MAPATNLMGLFVGRFAYAGAVIFVDKMPRKKIAVCRLRVLRALLG
jgi:hypothetical protein